MVKVSPSAPTFSAFPNKILTRFRVDFVDKLTFPLTRSFDVWKIRLFY